MSRTVQVTFDSGDPNALARFWTEVLGYSRHSPRTGLRDLEGGAGPLRRAGGPARHRLGHRRPRRSGPRVFFQKVPERKTAKNRVHLDVRAAPGLEGDERMAALEVECERLVALGATRVRRTEPAPPMSAASS